MYVQALELALRRAGFKVLLLSIGLEPQRAVRALRGTGPAAVVVAGADATLDVVGRLVYAIRRAQPRAAMFEYRGATPLPGKHGVPPLGGPGTAVAAIRRTLEEVPSARRGDVDLAGGSALGRVRAGA